MSEETYEPDLTPGIVAWNEVMTSDKAGCVEFYSNLFGWTTEDMEMPDGNTYTMFKVGERPVAGCVVPPEDSQVPPMWLNYINVDDLDAAIEKARALGGSILKERVDLPMGSFAVIADPQGASFAFWKMSADCKPES